MRTFLLLFVAIVLSVNAHAQAKNPPMVYRYWDWGKTPKRDDYQVAILRLALEKTHSRYGDFTLMRINTPYSTSRVNREVNRGENINIHAAPWRPLETDPARLSERNIKINVPLLNGLLGFRQLIVRKSDLETFESITSQDVLQKKTAGFARGWQDVDILRQNGYKVNDDSNVYSLISMLKSRRIDYIPMSILEVPSMLIENGKPSTDLRVVPNMIVYYPIPLIFYVSFNQPELAARVTEGLEIAKKDGSFDQIFWQHFPEETQQLKAKKIKRFILKNPFLPPEFSQLHPIFLED